MLFHCIQNWLAVVLFKLFLCEKWIYISYRRIPGTTLRYRKVELKLRACFVCIGCERVQSMHAYLENGQFIDMFWVSYFVLAQPMLGVCIDGHM